MKEVGAVEAHLYVFWSFHAGWRIGRRLIDGRRSEPQGERAQGRSWRPEQGKSVTL